MKSIFLTGVTSFTGSHIAHAFKKRGWRVVASLSAGRESTRDALVEARLKHAQVDEWVENATFGSDAMLGWLRSNSVDAFVNHGASIQGYRLPDFDYLPSVRAATYRGQELCETLAKIGCKRFLHSGSIFESDEGSESPGTPASSEAMSIYGVSKKLSWEVLRFYAKRSGLALSKIVIPNPVGPFENGDRLIPVFLRAWRAGQTPMVKPAQLIRDNIPAPWLAEFYVNEAEESLANDASYLRVRRPSGYALSNHEFVTMFLDRLKKFDPAAARYTFNFEQPTTLEPLRRINTEKAPELSQPEQENAFWEQWLTSLSR